MSYEPDNEASDLKKAYELIEELTDTVYEQGIDVGEENATGPIFDQQGKIRYITPVIV